MLTQAQYTIVDLSDPVVSGIAPSNPAVDMLWLDTSQSPAVLKRWSGSTWEIVNQPQVGGVNLISDSAQHVLVADGANSYWLAADELDSGMTYTLSVREVILVEGTAAAVTWRVVEQNTGAVHASGTLDFTYGKQIRHFTIPATSGNWALYLYAGIAGSTTGVTVQFMKIQLEEGSCATTWRPAQEDADAALGQLQSDITLLDEGMEDRVNTLIAEMGLSDQFASAEEFLAAVNEIELLRSEMSQTDSDLTLMFSRLLVAEGNITQMYSSFVFGDDDGEPYFDMSASASSIKMRLTNTRLAFVQSGKEMAYFSDNKLYVTRLEVVEQISIGTPSNGYLDMVTTPTGVGFKWRS